MGINRHSLEAVRTVAVKGGQIELRCYRPHCDEAADRIPLLLTHGGPGGSSVGLYDALHPLADQRPTLFYDQLGSFTSPAELQLEQMTLKRFATEPLCILDQLRIPHAHLFGHSWGGAVMTQFCLDHPDRVKALLLSSPLLSTQRWLTDCNQLIKKMQLELGESVNLEEEFERRHFCRSTKDADQAALRCERRRGNYKLYKQIWGPSEFQHQGMLSELDLFPSFQDLSHPTLLICGEYDTATPQTMKDAKSAIGDCAQLKVLKDAGHKTYIDRNQALVEVVNDFLAQQD
ncbi:alpha/beta fold hydrolase [Synechococcus sp. UW179A]|uniref:alpha/beta fold hydrolase n=1 Tax=Synechococcus sp. UW179A TaxID=2575510 RepID=UPI000E0E8B32|nr:alpha/beta fold hydrolase [Synechococcus sp. UW179A]